MLMKQLHKLDARFRVLSVAIQEVCRALPRSQAVEVAQSVRFRLANLPIEASGDCRDEATVRELAPLLAALA